MNKNTSPHTAALFECSVCCHQFSSEAASQGGRAVCPNCGAHWIPNEAMGRSVPADVPVPYPQPFEGTIEWANLPALFAVSEYCSSHS